MMGGGGDIGVLIIKVHRHDVPAEDDLTVREGTLERFQFLWKLKAL